MLRKCAWLLVLSICALPAVGESKARIVRLSYVEGDVQLDRNDGVGFVRAFQNMPVIEGVRLWTRSDARVEVEVEDGSTLRLTPDSIVDFEELQLGNSGEKLTRVDVQQGTLYANLKEHDHDQLTFKFAQQELKLRHSSRFRLSVDKDQLKVAVFRGELELQRPNDERVKIKKNETLAIDLSEPDRYYLAKGISEDTYDYWDRDREEQRVVAESRYRAEQAPATIAPYAYNDLAWYGSWLTVPDYGYVWRPYGAAIGWDPFAYGAWVWYPRYGYVWTSAYPWGWTPYRYGSWVYVHSHGWCWRSGPQINITNINIVNAPPRYIGPRPPVVNGVPIVTVAAGVTRPADPHGRWMPRVYEHDLNGRIDTGDGYGHGATRTPGVFTAVGANGRPDVAGRRDLADDVAAGGDTALTNRRDGAASRDVERIPGVNTKASVNGSSQVKTRDQSTRVKTQDKDYNAVDYRRPVNRDRDADPATMPNDDVADASRRQRGRPDPDRDDVSRPPANRSTNEVMRTPNSDGPQPNSGRTNDRSDARNDSSRADRPASQPRTERSSPPPRVERPASAPRASAPERSSPPPAASVPRSSPPPTPSPAPSPAPAAPSHGGGSRPRSQ